MSTSEIDRELHTQVLKREEAKEKAYREERNRQEEEFHAKLGMGGSEMSKQELKKIIDSDRRMYYRTEEINDKLYIHYKGWRELKNLEGWTGLRTLYAECNAFSKISGLENCRQLRSLFLQENCISKISGLENLTQLWSLNLSSNFIERIEGLEGCKGLNTLILAKNKIGFGGIADIEKLADTMVCSLDVQENRIDDPDVVPEVFARMADLRVLYLKGNPAAKKVVNYRKSLTVYCKELRYLDDRPVFEDDRRTAEAFNRGGIEEQRAEQKRIREEKTQAHERNMRAFSEMIENSKREKKERDAMRAEDKYTDETDPVESFERRCKRMQDQWKEEHKEELKDDAKEHAEKCLRAEREGQAASEETDGGDQQKATAESRDTCADSGDTGAAETDTADQEVTIEKKVDNRKLVYEDIWDDAPSGPSASQKPADNRKLVYDDIWDNGPSAPPSASAPSSAGPPKTLTPAGTEGVFMPWAEGAVGMDAILPSPEVLEKRKADLLNKAKEKSSSAESSSSKDDETPAEAKPSWHSKYLEQVSKTQAKLAAAVPSRFAPPSRISEKVSAPEAEIVRPDTEAETSSPQVGAGELDEMD